MKFTRVFATLGVVGAAALMLGSMNTVYADSDNAASVSHDGDCFISGAASGLSVTLGPADQTGYHKVITSKGIAVLTCHFAIPAGFEPDKALRNSGFGCNVGGAGPVTDSKSRATPGGTAMLQCQVK